MSKRQDKTIQQEAEEILSGLLTSVDTPIVEYLAAVLVELLENQHYVVTLQSVQESLGDMLISYGEVNTDAEVQRVCNKIIGALRAKHIISFPLTASPSRSPRTKPKSPSPSSSLAKGLNLAVPHLGGGNGGGGGDGDGNSPKQSQIELKKLDQAIRIIDTIPFKDVKKINKTQEQTQVQDSDDQDQDSDDQESNQPSQSPSEAVYELDYLDRARILAEQEEEKAERFIMSERGVGPCEMCQRPMPLTKHHLIPRTTHKKYRKKGLSQDFLNTCVDICRPCHSALHRLIDEKTLGRDYNTLDAIMAHEGVQKWINYAVKQKIRTKQDSLNPKIRYAK